MFGLKTSDIEVIIEILKRHPDVEEAIIFGSRAMGNYKVGSDVDIALKGGLKPNTANEITVQLNERISLPYKFDVIAYPTLTHKPLLEHIDRFGKILYKRLEGA